LNNPKGVERQKSFKKGWFVLDVQVHKANPDAALVEGGQLLAMHIDRDLECAADRDDHDDDKDTRH